MIAARLTCGGANLRAAIIAEWNKNNFKGATFDDDTAFPKGFDPETYGMAPGNAKEEKEASKAANSAEPFEKTEVIPAPSRKVQVDGKVAAVASIRKAAIIESPLPRLDPLAEKPMHVIGRAVFEDGRAIPNFTVSVLGYDGEPNLFAGSLPSLGRGTGTDGRYSVLTTDTINHKKPVKGLVVAVVAHAMIEYKGHIYLYELYPIDGKIDGTDKKAFRGESEKGVVRDFVMRMSGTRRGCNAADQGETLYRNAMIGGRISIDCTQSVGRNPSVEDATSLTQIFAPDSIIELKLVPTGPLLDGSDGETILRRFPLGETYGNWRDHFLRSIPIGEYTATATLTEPGGAPINLRLKLAFNEPLQSSATILWVPRNDNLGELKLFLTK